MKKLAILVVMVLVMANVASATIIMDWVTVGNADNDADTTTGYGSVDYNYNIGTYEVTTGQYTTFLNSVAATDRFGLYNASMDIQRSGSYGSYSYSVTEDYIKRPVNYVSWYDALRFTNWLHNSPGTGDTETGAYTITFWDGVKGTGTVSNRNDDAKVWLPSEDEWYKAAYYKPDDSGYSTYANGLETIPTADNGWNYSGGTYSSPWDVGTGTQEQNGTFDIMGNVWEWNETLIGSDSVIRGGSYKNLYGNPIGTSSRYSSFPSHESDYIGFRVASVPEPTTLALLTLGGLMLRRRRA